MTAARARARTPPVVLGPTITLASSLELSPQIDVSDLAGPRRTRVHVATGSLPVRHISEVARTLQVGA